MSNSFFKELLHSSGHTPVINENGQLNYWVYQEGHHSGPGCSVCGFSFCSLCFDPKYNKIPTCEETMSDNQKRKKELYEELKKEFSQENEEGK